MQLQRGCVTRTSSCSFLFFFSSFERLHLILILDKDKGSIAHTFLRLKAQYGRFECASSISGKRASLSNNSCTCTHIRAQGPHFSQSEQTTKDNQDDDKNVETTTQRHNEYPLICAFDLFGLY